MTKQEEAIEKIKEAIRMNDHDTPMQANKSLRHALSLLQQPVCKTCGGSGKIPNPEYYGRGKEIYHSEYIPCPDCKGMGKQPTCFPSAGEFVKEIRSIISKRSEDKVDRRELSDNAILQLCDLLTAQAKTNAEQAEEIKQWKERLSKKELLKRGQKDLRRQQHIPK